MRYSSVCDGIGAAHVAWQPLGWQCQWTSEIEPFPVAVVEHHYGFRNLGDMTAITEDMLDEPVDLLVGGTPCQSFSVAGLRGGLADPRGNLALRFVQLVGVLRPSWVVWENVPGVLSSGGGRDFGTFLGALAELGYGFAYRVLDAQWFGVAQRRRRVFVVAHLGNWRRAAAVLFERESLLGNPPTRGAKGEIAPTIPARRTAGGGLGTDFDCDGGLIHSQYGFSDGDGGGLPKPLGAHALSKGRGSDLDNTTYISTKSTAVSYDLYQITAPVNRQSRRPGDPCHTLARDNAAYAAVAFTTEQTPKFKDDCALTVTKQSPSGGGQPQCVAFKESQSGCRVGHVHATLDANKGSRRMEGVVCGTRTTKAVACDVVDTLSVGANQTTGFVGDAVASCEVSSTLRSNPGSGWRSNGTPVEGVVISPMAVRRLTPRECERLQGFPDDYTLVTYRNKPAADGPRYRALGNSMAVPVMAWIGQRIQMVKEATDG
jgi:DNA (cytosine-5)-methyltransferase 1